MICIVQIVQSQAIRLHNMMLHLYLYQLDQCFQVKTTSAICHSSNSSLLHYIKASGYSWPPKVCCPGNVELDAPCFPTDPHCSSYSYEENSTLSDSAKHCCTIVVQIIEIGLSSLWCTTTSKIKKKLRDKCHAKIWNIFTLFAKWNSSL